MVSLLTKIRGRSLISKPNLSSILSYYKDESYHMQSTSRSKMIRAIEDMPGFLQFAIVLIPSDDIYTLWALEAHFASRDCALMAKLTLGGECFDNL